MVIKKPLGMIPRAFVEKKHSTKNVVYSIYDYTQRVKPPILVASTKWLKKIPAPEEGRAGR